MFLIRWLCQYRRCLPRRGETSPRSLRLRNPAERDKQRRRRRDDDESLVGLLQHVHNGVESLASSMFLHFPSSTWTERSNQFAGVQHHVSYMHISPSALLCTVHISLSMSLSMHVCIIKSRSTASRKFSVVVDQTAEALSVWREKLRVSLYKNSRLIRIHVH